MTASARTLFALLILLSIANARYEATGLQARHRDSGVVRLRGGKPRLKKWKQKKEGSKKEKRHPRNQKEGKGKRDERAPGTIRVMSQGNIMADKSREVVLKELCSRQTCNALDPSLYDFEGAGLEREKYSSLQDYIEWTKEKKSSDDDVGITEYVTGAPGLGGLLKARWFDFRVNEMRLEEEVPVLLTDAASLPPRPWPLRDELDNQDAGFYALKPHFGKDVARRAFLFASEVFKNFTTGEGSAGELQRCTVNIGSRDPSGADKDFARFFPFLKVSFALPIQASEGSRTLTMTANQTWFKQRARALATCGGIEKVEEKKYLSFILAKSGWDTTTLVNKIASYLKVNARSFTFAGLKDKSGITEQEVRSYGIAPSRLLGLNDGKMKGVLLGNFKYVESPLRFGQHGGNRFEILLRHIRPLREPSMLNKTMEEISRRGFINYFGHQRFGNSAASMMPSIAVGKLLSKEDWESAVSETLRPPSLSCSPNERKAKLMYAKHKDVDEALKLMPGYCHDERVLLQALKDGKSAKEAALSMPHARLFKFAYWSRVWNLMASERARRMSMEHAVEGDIVLVRKDRNKSEAILTSHFSSYTKDGENTMRFNISNSNAPEIHFVTAKEEKEAAFGISEVVLPMVDEEVYPVLPKNGLKTFVRRLIEKDGMKREFQKGKKSSHRCSFRSLVIKPKNVRWQIVTYNNRDWGCSLPSPLAPAAAAAAASAAGCLPFAHPPPPPPLPPFPPILQIILFFLSTSESHHMQDLQRAFEGHDQCGGEGKWKALIVSFILPPSSYATMMMREIMKASTHPSDQFRLRLKVEADEDTAVGNKWQSRLKNLLADPN